MENFLDQIFLDNPIRLYLMVAGSILLAFLLRGFISKLIAGLLFILVKQVATGMDKKTFVRMLIRPLASFLVIMVTIIALEKLRFPELLNVSIYRASLHAIVETAATITVILSFVWLLLRILDFIAALLEEKANVSKNLSNTQLIVFFKDFFKVILVIIGVLLVLKFGFSFRISSLITGLSLAGAAIALATRESIENLIASFIIFFDKPFTAGDLVKVQTITGTVERIGLRSTRIRTDQKTYVSVPNKQMVDTIMDNLSLRSQRRAFVQLDLSAATAPDSVMHLIQRIKHILESRKDKVENFTVFLSDISKNAFLVHVEFFSPTIPAPDFNLLRQEINLAIIQLLDEMKIKLVVKDFEMVKP